MLIYFLSILIMRAVAAAIPNNVTVGTECKSCPYSLCTNFKIYEWEHASSMNLTCWTEGTEIVGDT